MNRILIFGNSGSGKTWLASKLSDSTKVCYSLDHIFWEAEGYNQKKSENDVAREIQDIKNQSRWIVEGVFGHLLVELLDFTDVIIFLDLPWSNCKEALLKRGSESSKKLDKEEADKNFQELVKWASGYTYRDTKASQSYHAFLYKQFDKVKYKLSSRNEINDFIKQHKC